MTKRNRTKRYNKGFSETGASRTRKSLKSFNPQSGSPNEDITYNLYELRTRARTLSMAGGLPLSALKTNRTNVYWNLVGYNDYPLRLTLSVIYYTKSITKK